MMTRVALSYFGGQGGTRPVRDVVIEVSRGRQ